MSPTELNDVLRATPFEPFRLHVTDGTTYDIDDPHRVLVANRYVHLGIPANPGDRISDRIIRIDLLHVTQTVPLVSPPKSGGNGQQIS